MNPYVRLTKTLISKSAQKVDKKKHAHPRSSSAAYIVDTMQTNSAFTQLLSTKPHIKVAQALWHMLRTVLHFLPQPKKRFFHCKYCTKRFALRVSLIFVYEYNTSEIKWLSNVLHRFLMLEISTYTEISVSNPQTKKLSEIKVLKNFTIIVGEFSKNTRFPQNLNSVQTFLKKVHFDQFDFFTGGLKSKKGTIKKRGGRKNRKLQTSSGRKSKQKITQISQRPQKSTACSKKVIMRILQQNRRTQLTNEMHGQKPLKKFLKKRRKKSFTNLPKVSQMNTHVQNTHPFVYI